MKDISFFTKIYLALDPVDFRKQSNSLFLMIESIFKTVPNCGKSLFVFTNRKKDSIRFVYWDLTGIAMWSKRLENERFKWIKSKKDSMLISSKELRWILEGIDLNKIKRHKKVSFESQGFEFHNSHRP